MNIQSKRKVAFFLPSLAGGGAEKVFINLSIYFAKKNYEVSLVTINNSKDYDIDFNKYKIKYITLNQKRLFFSFFKLFRFFLKNKFDIIFSTIIHLNIFLFFINKFFFKYKIILRESNNLKLNLKNKNFFIRIIYNFLIRIAYKNSILISPSEKLRIDLIKDFKLNPKKVFVINNPISGKFNNEFKIKNYQIFLQSLGLNKSENIKIVLNIGSFTTQKNQIQIIKSFLYLREYEYIKLIIVGKGPLKNKLIEYINKNDLKNTVYLVNFTPNIEAFLNFASLYVCSSLWEGFPNSLIDAGSYNIPIISNNCEYGPEEILEGGQYGSLCEINNTRQMANLIKAGVNNNIKKIPQEIMQKKYNINKIGHLYEKVIYE